MNLIIPIDNPLDRSINSIREMEEEFIIQASKQKKDEVLKEKVAFLEACNNILPIEESINVLEIYNKRRNSPVEMIITDNNAYVKYGELSKASTQ